MSKVKEPRAVEPLLAALADSSKTVRQHAARALGKIGDARAVGGLIATLKDDDSAVRMEVAEALIKLEGAVEPLIVALKNDDEPVQLEVAKALGKIGDSLAAGPLVTSLQRGTWALRQAAAEALPSLKWQPKDDKQNVLLALVEALTDKVSSVRAAAAKAIGKIGDTQAHEQLMVALKDSSQDVREAAASALNKLGWRPPDDTQRILQAIALRKWQEVVAMGNAALEMLVTLIKSGDHLREDAAKAIIVILEQSAKNITNANLRAVIDINDVRRAKTRDSCGIEYSYWVYDFDGAQLRQIARQELIRRGTLEAENLTRWRESGQPSAWIEMHQGRWDHENWLLLLDTLKSSTFWPLDPDAVGRMLEELKNG